MTKRWGPNCTSDLTKSKRRAAKEERAKAKADLWADDQQRIYWEKEERITGRKIKE